MIPDAIVIRFRELAIGGEIVESWRLLRLGVLTELRLSANPGLLFGFSPLE